MWSFESQLWFGKNWIDNFSMNLILACVAKMSLTLNSPIWNVIGSNLHTTSDACTSSLPNMEGITNNILPNSFELKDNSNAV